MSSDLLCQVRPTFGRVAVGDLPKIENPKNPDEYSYPQIAKVAVRKGTMNLQELYQYLVKEYKECKTIQASAIGEGYDYEAGRADVLSQVIHLLEKGE